VGLLLLSAFVITVDPFINVMCVRFVFLLSLLSYGYNVHFMSSSEVDWRKLGKLPDICWYYFVLGFFIYVMVLFIDLIFDPQNALRAIILFINYAIHPSFTAWLFYVIIRRNIDNPYNVSMGRASILRNHKERNEVCC